MKNFVEEVFAAYVWEFLVKIYFYLSKRKFSYKFVSLHTQLAIWEADLPAHLACTISWFKNYLERVGLMARKVYYLRRLFNYIQEFEETVRDVWQSLGN